MPPTTSGLAGASGLVTVIIDEDWCLKKFRISLDRSRTQEGRFLVCGDCVVRRHQDGRTMHVEAIELFPTCSLGGNQDVVVVSDAGCSFASLFLNGEGLCW